MLAQPSALNSTLSLADGPAPPPAPTQALWDDLFLVLDGPELARAELARGSTQAALVGWAQDWCEQWAAPGKGLLSPVQIRSTPTGAVIYFDPRPGLDKGGRAPSRVGLEGGVELVVDAPAAAPSKLRVRARRCAYSPQAVLKPTSEELIVRQLKDDLARLFKQLAE